MISKNKFNDYVFYISYGCLLSYSLLGQVEALNTFLKLFSVIGVTVVVLSLIIQGRFVSTRQLIYHLLLLCVAAIASFVTGDYSLIKLCLFIIGLRALDFDKCVKFDLVLRVILMLLVFYLYYLGIAKDSLSYMNRGTVVRHSLGFSNPNALGLSTIILCLDILYINKFQFNIRVLFFIPALVVFSIYYTKSRSLLTIAVISMILVAVNTAFPEFYKIKIVKKLLTNSFNICMFTTAILVLLFMRGNSFAEAMNIFLSERVYNAVSIISKYGVRMFGMNVSTQKLAVDSIYTYLFIAYGPILLLLVAFFFKKLFLLLYEYEYRTLIFVLFLFSIYGMSERLWICIDYNVFILMMWLVANNKPICFKKEI